MTTTVGVLTEIIPGVMETVKTELAILDGSIKIYGQGATEIDDINGLQEALDDKQPLAEVLTGTTASFTTELLSTLNAALPSSVIGVSVAQLVGGTVPADQLPSYVDDVLEFANLSAFPATGATGKIYVALDTNKAYRWSGSAYIYITSGAVDSVAGRTGVITLTKADVGLSLVDNTADLSKPISTLTQTALNTKQDTLANASASVTGKLLNTDWVIFNAKQRLLNHSYISEKTDLLNNTLTAQGAFIGAAVAGGSINNPTSDYTAAHQGIWTLRSAISAANGGYSIQTSADLMMLAPSLVFDTVFKTPASNANNVIYAGFHNGASITAPTNGAYITINAGVVTGNNSSAGTSSATATLATLAVDTWYHARLTINATLTSVLYEIYSDAGALLGSGSLTSNISTARLRAGICGFHSASVGTAAEILKVDYVGFYGPLARGAL